MKTIKLIVLALLLTGTGLVFLAQSAPDDRIKELEAQVAREPKNAKLIQQLGWAYFVQGREGNPEAIEKAITTFERGISVAPDNREMVRTLGLAYFVRVAYMAKAKAPDAERRVALEKTLSTFDRALALAPDDTVLLSAHGSALSVYAAVTRNLELFNKGMDEMNRAVSLDPKAVHARLFRGFTGINLPLLLRKPEVIAEDLSVVLKAATYSENTFAQSVLRVLLGDVHLEAKRIDEAKAEYQAAAKLDTPGAAEGRARLAAFEQGGPEQSAIQRFRGTVINCTACHKQ